MLKSRRRSTFCALMLIWPAWAISQISIGVSVNFPPPELPIYDQPLIPGDGYLWTPGYWAWSDDVQDYYWVPGTWVQPPQLGYLWTPGYWDQEDEVFAWHGGFWGPEVGFYGGVNYGYGYGGRGYEGGYWQGGRIFYNRSVNNINTTNITNVYNRTAVNNTTVNRVSYNGRSGGARAQPTPIELAATRDRHIEVTPLQRQHEQAARNNQELRASQNQGRPPIAATPRPGELSGPGVRAAKPGGTMSVIHANPPPREATPNNWPPQMERGTDLQRAPQPRENVMPRQPPFHEAPPPRDSVTPRQPQYQTPPPRETTPRPMVEPRQNYPAPPLPPPPRPMVEPRPAPQRGEPSQRAEPPRPPPVQQRSQDRQDDNDRNHR